jgi:hypothetical protein
MTDFQIHVIFHKFLIPECYEDLSGADIERYVRFFAVNAKIPKEIPSALQPYVLQERQLPWYNPFLQHNRFCESSAFFHVWKNPDIFQKKYIGFFHYDMVLKREMITFLEENTGGADEILFVHSALIARQHLCQVIPLENWNIMVKMYNAIFQTNHTIYDVLDKEIPLYHTFVIHHTTFHRMMSYAEAVIPYLFEMIRFDTNPLPYMLERLHGVFLALQRLDGKIRWLPLPGVTHRDDLKDSWKQL